MQFKFIVEEGVALPVDPTFWDYLMASAQTQWSLIVYEQDWLNVQFSKTKALQVQKPNPIANWMYFIHCLCYLYRKRLILVRYG